MPAAPDYDSTIIGALELSEKKWVPSSCRDGILWVLRTGAPWRDMPERYGNWNSVFVRFTRWSKLGVWDAVFETLASLGPPADEEHAIDSTIVRAHQHAAGEKGGIKIRKRSGARAAASRPKSTSARTPKATR
jgi:transposase